MFLFRLTELWGVHKQGPSNINLRLYSTKVGYADGILGELGSKANVEAFIASIWTHLQVNYCHASLGSKVVVERLPEIKYYPVGELKANSAGLKKMYETTLNNLGSADLMLYMGFIGNQKDRHNVCNTVYEFNLCIDLLRFSSC